MILVTAPATGNLAPMEQLPLFLGIAAAAFVVFWIVKKLFKLALYAGIAGVIAWLWYFNVSG